MLPPDHPPLDYAPPARAAVYRRWTRRVIRWGALAALLAVTVVYGPTTVRQVWYLRAQRRCMAFALPSSTVVYSNAPAEAAALLAGGYKPVASVVGRTFNVGPPGNGDAGNAPTVSAGYAFKPLADVGEDTIGSYAPSAWGTYQRFTWPNAPIRTGGFLHALREPNSNEERLVSIVFLERQDPLAPNPLASGERRLEINALVWRTASIELGSRLQLSGLSTLLLTKLNHREVRVFAAKLDPQHADRFAMPYIIDRHAGTIDGQLEPYGGVSMQVRAGSAVDARMVDRGAP